MAGAQARRTLSGTEVVFKCISPMRPNWTFHVRLQGGLLVSCWPLRPCGKLGARPLFGSTVKARQQDALARELGPVGWKALGDRIGSHVLASANVPHLRLG